MAMGPCRLTPISKVKAESSLKESERILAVKIDGR
jgi:hypothetical protein